MRKLFFFFSFLFYLAVTISAQENKVRFARPDLVKPFSIHVSQQHLDEIRRKVSAGKIPRQMPPDSGFTSNWQTGMDMEWLKGLQDYWVKKYDWRKAERRLNSYPQFIAHIDEYNIQFYFIKGEGKNPTPLI